MPGYNLDERPIKSVKSPHTLNPFSIALPLKSLRVHLIYLVHHAEAVITEVDPMRPLSARGRATVAHLALQATQRGVCPLYIWHSGKLRARQTAEAFWKACNPFATMTAKRGLQPADSPVWIRDQFQGDIRELMAVGHMPHLERLLKLMLGVEVPTEEMLINFPRNGMVALHPIGDSWEEQWRLEV